MKTSTISSNNLLHVFKRKLVNAHELNSYMMNNPNTSRRVGSLPIDFFKYIPNAKKSDITQQVADVFEAFSIASEEVDEPYSFGVTDVAQKMVESLKKILNRGDIETSYVGSGSFKNCQKIKVGKFSYALSTFKKHPVFDERGYFRTSHGKGNEPQAIFTAYKRYSQGRICRPFIVNLSSEKDDGGFILSKFIDANSPGKVEQGFFQTNRKIFKNIDIRGNSVNGIFIEAGGFIPNKKYISDRDVRNILQDFAICFDNNIELLKNPKANELQQVIYENLENRIDIFDQNNFNTLMQSLTKEEGRIARKLLKNMATIKYLKDNTNPEIYSEIRNLLQKDLAEAFPFDMYSEEFCPEKTHAEIYNGYPLLLAKEMGIDNRPDFEDMCYFLADSLGCVDIDLSKYYSKNEILDFISKNTLRLKNMFIYDFLIENLELYF